MATRPIITLTTDFGSADSYVAQMKGVILDYFRRLSAIDLPVIVDVTHAVPRHDVRAAASIVVPVASTFPPGTVHLVVVDPGVGTRRRPLAVLSAERYYIGPDNGILTPVLGDGSLVVEVDSAIRRPSPADSRLFDGRDLFAPAAARLAAGVGIRELGGEIRDALLLEPGEPVTVIAPGLLLGRVERIDGFGNLETNIPAVTVPRDGTVRIAGAAPLSLARAYGDVACGEPVALVSSNGFVEIAINGGSARETLRAEPGAVVEVRLSPDPQACSSRGGETGAKDRR